MKGSILTETRQQKNGVSMVVPNSKFDLPTAEKQEKILKQGRYLNGCVLWIKKGYQNKFSEGQTVATSFNNIILTGTLMLRCQNSSTVKSCVQCALEYNAHPKNGL